MTSQTFSVLSGSFFLGWAALAHASPDQALSAADKAFMTSAASGSAYELQLSKIAQSKAQDPKVRQYADMIVSDHTTADKQFQLLARHYGVDVSTTPSGQDQAKLDKIGNASGAAFDKAYLALMKEINQQDIGAEQQEIAATGNTQLKQFVQTMLKGDSKHKRGAETLTQSKS